MEVRLFEVGGAGRRRRSLGALGRAGLADKGGRAAAGGAGGAAAAGGVAGGVVGEILAMVVRIGSDNGVGQVEAGAVVVVVLGGQLERHEPGAGGEVVVGGQHDRPSPAADEQDDVGEAARLGHDGDVHRVVQRHRHHRRLLPHVALLLVHLQRRPVLAQVDQHEVPLVPRLQTPNPLTLST